MTGSILGASTKAKVERILDHVLLLSPVFSPPSAVGYPVYYSIMGFKHAAVLAPVCFFLGALTFEVILPGT